MNQGGIYELRTTKWAESWFNDSVHMKEPIYGSLGKQRAIDENNEKEGENSRITRIYE